MTETLSSESDANQIVEYLLKEVAPKYKKDFEKKREIKLKRKVIKLEKSDKPEEIAVKSSVDVFASPKMQNETSATVTKPQKYM